MSLLWMQAHGQESCFADCLMQGWHPERTDEEQGEPVKLAAFARPAALPCAMLPKQRCSHRACFTDRLPSEHPNVYPLSETRTRT